MGEKRSAFLVALETSIFFLIEKEVAGDNSKMVQLYKQLVEDLLDTKNIENLVHVIKELKGQVIEYENN